MSERPYMNLQIEMLKKGVTQEELAKLIKRTRLTISNKLQGETSFLVEEAFLIQKTFFPDKELNYLFRRTKKN